MKLTSFFVHGKPVPDARPRVTRWGTYILPHVKAYREHVRASFRSEYPDHVPFDCPISIEVTFYMPRPVSHNRTGKYALLRKAEHWFNMHFQKPDLSNLIKNIEDAMNDLVYKDDSQIVIINAKKLWACKPEDAGAKIVISELELM